MYRCTCAASAIFSNGSRGTPGWENTLNRVPELPNAQLGTSIVNSARPLRTLSARHRRATPGSGAVPAVIVVLLAVLRFACGLLGRAGLHAQREARARSATPRRPAVSP